MREPLAPMTDAAAGELAVRLITATLDSGLANGVSDPVVVAEYQRALGQQVVS